MGCPRKRLSNNDEFQPEGRKLSTRLISTVPSQEIPSRCFSESISRSRWLLTGQTGTHEPQMTHSSVKRATCGATTSEMVARLRSAMFTVEDRGTGQARMQRSQPMHISISKRTSSSVNGTISARCWMPTTSFSGCICIMVIFLQWCGTHLAETRYAAIFRATAGALFVRRWRTIGAGRDCSILGALIDKVDDDVAYGDTIAVREPVRVVDPGLIDHHAVTALQVTNIHTVLTR